MTTNPLASTTNEAGFVRLRFALLLNQGPFSTSNRHAIQFAQAILQRGHQLLGIFFMDQAVLNANPLLRPASDEYPLSHYWQQLAEQQVPLYLCASAAERFGLNDADSASQSNISSNIAKDFQLTGLGEWISLSQAADRVVSF